MSKYRKSRTRMRFCGAVISLALVAVACGSDDDDAEPAATDAAPAATDAAPAATDAARRNGCAGGDRCSGRHRCAGLG